ncbi:MAG: MAPEG family protein, partial [Gammaproteobacteria bacterium]
SIFWPMIVLAALTFVVEFRMYFRRAREIRSKQLRLSTIATRREMGAQLQDTAAADNYHNLFELPVLFYVLCIVLYVAGMVTVVQLALAWAFVASRIVHSGIQLTTNRVRYRFLAFVTGTFILIAMWLLFTVSLLIA